MIWVRKGVNLRYRHEKLLVRVTCKNRFGLESLRPGFLDDHGTAVRLALVESSYAFEVDVFPEDFSCVRVLVDLSFSVVMVVVVAVISMAVARVVVVMMVGHIEAIMGTLRDEQG